jgi:hypothetical protein
VLSPSPGLLLRAVAVVTACALLEAPVLHTQVSKPNEYQVKAVYLYNFGRFVEWPARAASAKDDSFAICVLGQDPFGAALDSALAGESIDGKSVVAKRISTPQDALTCRILFISSSEDVRLKDDLIALGKTGVLTVSDMPHFSQRGGMIQFVSEGNRIRFEVNLTIAQDAGLTLSSELLKVAIAVKRNPHPGD